MSENKPGIVDVEFLRSCPQRLAIHRMRHGQSLIVEQYARLRARGWINGGIDVLASSRELLFVDVTLTNAGRRALGITVQGEDDADQHA